MTSATTPVSTAAKQQHQNNDKEDQIHKTLLGGNDVQVGNYLSRAKFRPHAKTAMSPFQT
jgi:hypothetical protein